MLTDSTPLPAFKSLRSRIYDNLIGWSLDIRQPHWLGTWRSCKTWSWTPSHQRPLPTLALEVCALAPWVGLYPWHLDTGGGHTFDPGYTATSLAGQWINGNSLAGAVERREPPHLDLPDAELGRAGQAWAPECLACPTGT